MLKPKIKTAMNRLQQLYYSNLISYPRVEISYSTHPQSMLSHKPLAIIAPEFEPFGKKKKVVDFNSSLLFLHTKRLITPALVPTISSYIDEFYDANLKLQKELELQRLIVAKNEFLQSQEAKNSFFTISDDLGFFKPKYFEIYESENGSKSLEKVEFPITFYLDKKSKKPKEELVEEDERKIKDGINFKNLREFRNYLIEKNERLINENNKFYCNVEDYSIKF